MIHCIYLAAGNSRRFGKNKLCEPFGSKLLYQHGLDKLSTAVKKYKNASLTVVSQYKEILDDTKKKGFLAVFGENSQKGISYSIKSALESIPNLGTDDYILFLVADQPYISLNAILKLMNTVEEKPLCACTCYNDELYNPALFSSRLMPELRNLSGDCGGKKIIRNHLEDCVLVSFDSPKETLDIDTSADLFRIPT